MSERINISRENVLAHYNAAITSNKQNFIEGHPKATKEYIWDNQKEDAQFIVNKFNTSDIRVISVQKKTKVGADGLMIEIVKLMTTHSDDDFVVHSSNVRIITGMSNTDWEKDMIDKAPQCFKDKIYHHGKLQRADLMNLSNGLIIIDEIDTGDKVEQVLHKTLKEAGVLNVEHMKRHNNHFVLISATMIKELHDLYRWGNLHECYKMTIPVSYISHKDFLDRGIIQEFYSLNTPEKADKWVQEDILDKYKTDYRVHIVRVTNRNVHIVQDACIRKDVAFRNHTSDDRLTKEEEDEFFNKPLTQHIVIGVKGFFRRANLIPNSWKLRIGATHELHTNIVDYNVQIQGLTGRMTGYWKEEIDNGHITGPHRTSIKAIEEYERAYEDPLGKHSYQTSGFKKREGKIIRNDDDRMVAPKHVEGLKAVDLPVFIEPEDPNDPRTVPIVINITPEEYATFAPKDKDEEKKRNKWDIDLIFTVIAKYNSGLVDTLKTLKKIQITQNERKDTNYKRRILDFVKASTENRKYTLGTGEVVSDSYQIFLDQFEHRIVVSIYYGSKKQ